MPGINDKFGRASIPTDTAVATTVKTTRAAGVLVLEAFDLSKFATDTPVFFVTYKKTTDPVTGIVSITGLVSWKALVNSGANTLTNLTIQPGYVDNGNAIGDFIECIPTSAWENSLIDGLFVGHNPDGSFKKSQLQTDLGNDGRLVDTLNELTDDFILSGGIWTALTGLNAGMTALSAYINGYKGDVAAVATRSFTLSKDTYIDVLKDPSTHVFSLVYTEVANGAASPALAANSVRLAKVVTNGSTVTSVTQSGNVDSLNNVIYPTAAIGGKNIDFTSFLRRLDNTTNTPIDNAGLKMQIGWGYVSVASGATNAAKSVTYPRPFTAVPILNPGLMSYKSGAAPTSAADVSGALGAGVTLSIESASATGFSARVYNTGAVGATTHFLFTWLAIGV